VNVATSYPCSPERWFIEWSACVCVCVHVCACVERRSLGQTLLHIVVLHRRERSLQAHNLLSSTNVYLLRGVIQLGRLLAAAPKDISSACMSATDVWHTYVCCSCSVSQLLH